MKDTRNGTPTQHQLPSTDGEVAQPALPPESSLEKWLSGPDALVPGTNMDFYVAKLQERRDLIMYLKQVSGR
jgi:cytochrome c2